MGTDPIFRLLGKWGLSLILALSAPACAEERTLDLGNGETLRYTLITEPAESARETAMQLLRYLAAGDIEAAAAMSNAPQRRYEVLRDYRRSIGEDEFKRIYGRYFAPENRLLMEAAIGDRRLLVWDLGEAGNHLAAQYYIRVEGRFLVDDVPNEERSQLTRVLHHLRERYSR